MEEKKGVSLNVDLPSPFYFYLEVEVDEPGQGILIHRINVGQVWDHKEQDTPVLGNLKYKNKELNYG